MDSIEVMLLRWSDGPKGMTVTFQLDPDIKENPFKGEKAGQNGQRYAMALAKIADDETVEEKTPGEKAVIRAGILCKDPEFWKLVTHITQVSANEQFATRWLRSYCGILSRLELAVNPEAIKKLNEIYARFEDFKRYGDPGRNMRAG